MSIKAHIKTFVYKDYLEAKSYFQTIFRPFDITVIY